MSSGWRWLLVAVALAAPQTACARITFEIPEYEIPEDNAWDYYLEAFELLPEGDVWTPRPVGRRRAAAAGCARAS